jgi:hypothetical protein
VLIQPSSVFVCYSFAEQDIQCYYADFIKRADVRDVRELKLTS